ncbi:MAG TPA: hypothetical protein VFG65_08450 [Fimbriimonadales bacterium]|nr:hypothetical protein [Fimbriimonadales bacterium]
MPFPVRIVVPASILAAIIVASRPSAPTYSGQVAKILFDNCASCHRPGEVAPFSLLSYEDARKRAKTIAAVVQERVMPPWKAVHGYNNFLDERRLTDEQIEILKAWAEAGAPRGNVKAEPRPPTFASGWALGAPDMVVAPEKEFHIGAEGRDIYRNFVVDSNFKETRWVKAIDVRPGNPRVVHHVIVFLDGKGRAAKLEAKNDDGQIGYDTFGGVGFAPDGSLGGWAPGLRPHMTPDGTAFEVPPGTSFVIQMHYHRDGKPETDLTKIGLYFSKDAPKRTMQLAWIAQPFFRLRPGEVNQKVSLKWPVPVDVTAYAAMPHMHLLGKSMKAWVETQDGKTLPIIYVDDWNFNWQLTYAFKTPLKISAGSTVHVEAIYDNSKDNPRNPNDPPKPVGWGEQTTDEMMLLIVPFTIDGVSSFRK